MLPPTGLEFTPFLTWGQDKMERFLYKSSKLKFLILTLNLNQIWLVALLICFIKTESHAVQAGSELIICKADTEFLIVLPQTLGSRVLFCLKQGFAT